jgi:hypothetical protein
MLVTISNEWSNGEKKEKKIEICVSGLCPHPENTALPTQKDTTNNSNFNLIRYTLK